MAEANKTNRSTGCSADESAMFEEYVKLWSGKTVHANIVSCSTTTEHQPLVEHIPRFYRTQPREQDALKQQLRSEARSRLLQARSDQLLSHDELTQLHNTIDEHATLPIIDDAHRMIAYDDFVKVVIYYPIYF